MCIPILYLILGRVTLQIYSVILRLSLINIDSLMLLGNLIIRQISTYYKSGEVKFHIISPHQLNILHPKN